MSDPRLVVVDGSLAATRAASWADVVATDEPRELPAVGPDAPAYIKRIERAVKQQDGEALRSAAHALKGAIATVGSPAGRQAAAALEQAGRVSPS